MSTEEEDAQRALDLGVKVDNIALVLACIAAFVMFYFLATREVPHVPTPLNVPEGETYVAPPHALPAPPPEYETSFEGIHLELTAPSMYDALRALPKYESEGYRIINTRSTGADGRGVWLQLKKDN